MSPAGNLINEAYLAKANVRSSGSLLSPALGTFFLEIPRVIQIPLKVQSKQTKPENKQRASERERVGKLWEVIFVLVCSLARVMKGRLYYVNKVCTSPRPSQAL